MADRGRITHDTNGRAGGPHSAEDSQDLVAVGLRPAGSGPFTRDGLTVDTGQHVFLGCCTAYRGLLDKLGMTAHAPLGPLRRNRPGPRPVRPGACWLRGGRTPKPPWPPALLAPGGPPPRPPVGGAAPPDRAPRPPAYASRPGQIPFFLLPNDPGFPAPALAMRRVDPADPVVDEQRFGDWLAARGRATGPAAPCGTCSPSPP